MSKDDEDAQTVLNFLHQRSISFPCQTRKNQGAEANESIPSACGKQDLECENASIKKQISELKCSLSELKDEIAYERSENNVTVSMYKKLWNEARTELELSRLEILKINAEIEGIKKQFQKLKDTGISV
jgi:predicted  nucleic acid-binding Zn-ribbon protein